MSNSLRIYTIGGTVQAGQGVYIERRADEELYNLCKEMQFAYVLTARQMGKSSLMVGTAQRLENDGIRSAIIDLSQLGVQLTAEQWYLGLLTTIIDDLDIDIDIAAWWSKYAHIGVTQRMVRFFEDVLVNSVENAVVIFIDEIDSTLSLDFTDDFYAAVRALYNARATHQALANLSFVLIGVATPSDLIIDPARTPFNIGQRVYLTDFDFDEVLLLADGFIYIDVLEHREQVLRWIMGWTGGHPYLTQRISHVVAVKEQASYTESEINELVIETFLGEASQQDSNLQFVRDMILRRVPQGVSIQQLLETYQEVRLGRVPVYDEEQSLVKSHLKLAGIVRVERGRLVTRNRIYAEVFDRQWIEDNLEEFVGQKSGQQARVNWSLFSGSIVAIVIITSGFFFYNQSQQNTRATAIVQTESAVIIAASTSDARIEVAANQTATQEERDSANATTTARGRPSNTPTNGLSPTNTLRPTESPTPSFTGLQASRNLSVRAGPSADYAEITTINAGEVMEITGINGRWYQVVLPSGSLGWVVNSPTFINVFGLVDNIPVVEAATITPTPSNTPNRPATQTIVARETFDARARATAFANATNELATQDAIATQNAVATLDAQATLDIQLAIDANAAATQSALMGRMPYLEDFGEGQEALEGSIFDAEAWAVGSGAGERSVLVGSARISQAFTLLGNSDGGSPEWTEAGLTDFILSFRVNMDAGEGTRVVLRYTPGQAYYAVDIAAGRINVKRGERGYDPEMDRERERFIGNPRGYTTTMGLNEWYDITIWSQGQRIYIFVDNDLVATAVDDESPLPGSGDILFQTLNRTRDIYFDDIIVQQFNPASDHFESSRLSSFLAVSTVSGEVSLEVDENDENNHYIRLWRDTEFTVLVNMGDLDIRTRIYMEQGGYTLYLRESEIGALRLELDAGNLTVSSIDEDGAVTLIRVVENFYNRALWEDLRIRYVDDNLTIWMNGQLELNSTLAVSLSSGRLRFQSQGAGATADIIRIDDFLLLEPIN